MMYTRYIDNIFFIWTGNKQDLQRFFQHLNSVHPTIKFYCEFSSDNINFLDTLVCIRKQHEIVTKIYKIPTDEQPSLRQKSYHPQVTKDALPVVRPYILGEYAIEMKISKRKSII